MYTDNLDQVVLYEPAECEGKSCNKLLIVTGFTDVERISTHLIALADGMKEKKYKKGIQVDIILGMTEGTGLTEKKHKDIKRLLNRINSTHGMPKVTCNYIVTGKKVHSKVYVWIKGARPIVAFCGSANYSMNAFYKRRECMEVCNEKDAKKYYKELMKDCADCCDENIAEKIHFSTSTVNTNSIEIEDDNIENLTWDMYQGVEPIDTLQVSLLSADGDSVGHGSGLNWGIRPNGTKRNKNQAYIKYNKKDRKEGFFPNKLHDSDKNWPVFKVVTKDYGSFYMRRAQSGGKGLHTPESNAILGEWIRKQLGVPDGTFITKDMLEHYGKTYVTFKKYAEDIFVLEY